MCCRSPAADGRDAEREFPRCGATSLTGMDGRHKLVNLPVVLLPALMMSLLPLSVVSVPGQGSGAASPDTVHPSPRGQICSPSGGCWPTPARAIAVVPRSRRGRRSS